MKRREFLRCSTAALAAGALAPLTCLAKGDQTAAVSSAKWYKGNLHAHSQWSDGKDLPEVVIDAYKKRGYDFFCLTDHNVIQAERLRFDQFGINFTPSDLAPFEGKTSYWKGVSAADRWSNLTEEHLNRAREIFGADSVETLDTNDGLYVRMKTFGELNRQFGEADRFLLIPGFEMTAPNVHVNLLNVEEDFYLDDADSSALVSKLFDRAVELYADKNRSWLFTVNHPLWQFYNIQPSALIARPEIRHVELTNNNTSLGFGQAPGGWTPESFWDVVNAYRAAHEQPPLYVTGTDDSHGIFRTDFLPFLGWMYVRANRLSTDAIFDAMNRGDSYASSGLELADVAFDGNTLGVKIAPKEEGEYRIEFIGTKKDYDPAATIIDCAAQGDRPARKIESYSPQIGTTLVSADGLSASYTLKPDDLYVRAKAYRVGAGNIFMGSDYIDLSPLARDAAWTQPYRRGE